MTSCRKCALFTLMLIACISVTGCSTLKGRIKTPAATVSAVADAGKPATLNTSDAKEVLHIPAGAVVTVTKVESTPAAAATATAPAVAAVPERTTTVIQFPKESEWVKTEATVAADTGTVDTSIAAKKIDASENRVLLYAALGCLALAGVFVYLQYPTPAMMSAGGAVILFLAWKVSGMPDWIWAVGAVAVAGAAFLYFGHEKGLKTTSP